MSDLKTRITADFITAMKAGDKLRVSVRRILTHQIKPRQRV